MSRLLLLLLLLLLVQLLLLLLIIIIIIIINRRYHQKCREIRITGTRLKTRQHKHQQNKIYQKNKSEKKNNYTDILSDNQAKTDTKDLDMATEREALRDKLMFLL